MDKKKSTDPQPDDSQGRGDVPSGSNPGSQSAKQQELKDSMVASIERILVSKQSDEIKNKLLKILDEMTAAENNEMNARADLILQQAAVKNAEAMRILWPAQSAFDAEQAKLPSEPHRRNLEEQQILNIVWTRRLVIACFVLAMVFGAIFCVGFFGIEWDPTGNVATYTMLKIIGTAFALVSVIVGGCIKLVGLVSTLMKKLKKVSPPSLTPPSPART